MRGCPWWAFTSEYVAEVLRAARACRSGDGHSPGLLLPLDPPAVVWQGLVRYVEAQDIARGWEREREKARREQGRPPER